MISIEKFQGHLSGVVHLTASKSITNRVLIIKALSGIDFIIKNKASADDSIILEKSLQMPEVVDVRDAGTAYRFLTAYLSTRTGKYTLTGSNRMKQRPVGALVDALKSIGADIQYDGIPGFPPLKIDGKFLDGGEVLVDATRSSQYVSALLLIAPALLNGLTIRITGKIASRPYIEMTIELMRQFGITVEQNENIITITPQKYKGKDFTIENDWSSASFWYIMAAMSDSTELTLKNLFQDSVQGDSVIYRIMDQFGVKTEFNEDGIKISKNKKVNLPRSFKYDFIECPDLVIPLSVLCATLQIPAEFTGVSNLRIKESDRLSALEMELTKLGSEILIMEDSIFIKPGAGFHLIEPISSHNDHRIAMAFASLALKTKVMIDDPSVVSKSYPEFWREIKNLGFEFHF